MFKKYFHNNDTIQIDQSAHMDFVFITDHTTYFLVAGDTHFLMVIVEFFAT